MGSLSDMLQTLCLLAKTLDLTLRQIAAVIVYERWHCHWYYDNPSMFIWRIYYILRRLQNEYHDMMRMVRTCSLEQVREIIDAWTMEALL